MKTASIVLIVSGGLMAYGFTEDDKSLVAAGFILGVVGHVLASK